MTLVSVLNQLFCPIVLLASVTAAIAQSPLDPALVAQGEYLMRAADCEACHTVPGGRPLIGGRAFVLPFGVIYSPNITADNETGIGTWSDDDFVRALHQGIGKGGEHLYPAFPYASYTGMSRADALAIKAYLFSLPPVRSPHKENTLAFPFNQRWGMTIWNVVNLTDKRFAPDPRQSGEWNRGNYLANTLGHCGECHTPRTITYGLNTSKPFAGGQIEGWRAYNLSSDEQTGIGKWSDKQIASYLSEGHADGRGAAAGPMEEVVRLSLSHLTSEDIHALGTYLRSAAPQAASTDPIVNENPPALEGSSYVPSSVAPSTGQKIFEGSCASCHGWDGGGMQTPFAALKGNGAVNDKLAMNLVQVVLGGATLHTDNGDMSMPAFANSLSDNEIAALANYAIDRFGNQQAAITAKTVAAMRNVNQPSSLLGYAKLTIPIAIVVLLGLISLVALYLPKRFEAKG